MTDLIGNRVRIKNKKIIIPFNSEKDLESPLEVKENAWTDSTLSKKLPKPKSIKGKVESDSTKYYTFYASDMSLDDFNDYVEDLKKLIYN